MSRNIYLDYVRALAITLVVIYHSYTMAQCENLWVLACTKLGFYAVDIFFVLSGYLIGRLVFKETRQSGSLNVKRFILRRISRTLPLYYLVFSLLCVYLWYTGQKIYWPFLVFLQNYYDHIPYYSISWSLCVEEHFYLIFPFLYVLILQSKNKFFNQALLTLLLILPIILRLYHFTNNQVSTLEFGYYYTATHLRFEGLTYGVLMAYFVNHDTVRQLVVYRYWIFAAAFVLLCAPIFVKNKFYLYVPHYTLFTGAIALCLGVFAHLQPKSSSLADKFLYLIAIQSYSTYLVHSLVIKVVLLIAPKLGITNHYLEFLIMTVGSFLAGALLYNLVEKRLLTLRDKFVPA